MSAYLIRHQQDEDEAEAKLFSNPTKLGTGNDGPLVENAIVDLIILGQY